MKTSRRFFLCHNGSEAFGGCLKTETGFHCFLILNSRFETASFLGGRADETGLEQECKGNEMLKIVKNPNRNATFR